MASLLILAVLVSCLVAVQSVINTDVSQVIDATTSIVRYSADIKATEINGDYKIIFPESWAQHLAFISVSASKGKSLKVLPPVR